MKTKKIIVYTDGGHGWGKVALRDLLKLGIADQISTFSYYRPHSNIANFETFVYLEEDCDLGIYVNAMKANGITVTFKEYHSNKLSKLRSYARFDGKTLMENYKKAQESIAKQFIDSHFIFQKVGE
jgi:hypothetical protein